MHQRCKLLGLLTPNQAELLKALFERNTHSAQSLWRPLELGAYRSSHHHNTLKTLVEQGLVEQLQLPASPNPDRPRNGYRISCTGVKLWLEFVELADVAVLAVPGRARDRDRAIRTAALATA